MQNRKVWIICADRPEKDFIPQYWCAGDDFNESWKWRSTSAIRFVDVYDAFEVIRGFKAAGYERISGNKLSAVEIEVIE